MKRQASRSSEKSVCSKKKRKISDAKLRKQQVSSASLYEHLARKKDLEEMCNEANRCFGLMSSGDDFVEGGSLWDGFFRAIATCAYEMALVEKSGFCRPSNNRPTFGPYDETYYQAMNYLDTNA